MTSRRLRFDVPAEAEGRRLDRYLSELVPDRTRSAIRKLILDGRVRVDGAPAAKTGLPLKGGAVVAVELPPPPPETPLPESIPLDVIHEDEHLLVVVKPAGMVVHPGHGRRTGTLVNALIGRGTTLPRTGGPDRPGIVHRLDRETSGLLMVAKTDRAHHVLARAFADRRIAKGYVALVWGRPDPPSGSVERPIGRSRANPLKMAVRGTRGRTRVAVTRYEVRESMPGFSLLEVRLETGRTHQIRVHMQSIHHPVVGDARYGGRGWRGIPDPLKRKAVRLFPRLALHASDLRLEHPFSGEPLSFHAPLPPEFEELLQALRRTP
jgi:23S rRNA pseudouridine1911/1915/1917 synthase